MNSSSVAEVLTIGNEILDGRVTDTNRVYIGRELKTLGFEVRYAQSVDDHMDRIIAAFELAASRSDLIVCTGGLGPTSDDMTIDAFANFLGVENKPHPEAEQFVRDLLAKRGRPANESQLKQGRVPVGCSFFANPNGSAPGIHFKGKIKSKEVAFYFYPGIPRELVPMFELSILKDFQAKNYKTHTWSSIFSYEGELQELLKDLEPTLKPFKLGFRTQFPENHVSLMGTPRSEEEKTHWDLCVKKLNERLASSSYFSGEKALSYEESLLKSLSEKSARLILEESCTGGLIAHLLTEVAGSSSVFWGSQVCYANQEKARLGVDKNLFTTVGAVSDECARQMAIRGVDRLKEDEFKEGRFLFSLSTTGIAGPGGATDKKPLGLFYVGLAIYDLQTKETKVFSEEILGPQVFERSRMKIYMAKKALEFLRMHI